MSANQINELVVALRPEGVDETVDGLEDSQEAFEETAETASEESRNLEQFSQRFKGAMAVATTALAIASAGLLSKVPLIGEAFAGIGAILTSLGLALDQFLRDLGFGVVIDGFFDIAKAIDTADESMRDVIGAATGLAILFVGIASAVLAAMKAASLLGISLSGIGGAITGIVGGISLLTAGLIALVAGIVLFAAAYATNFMGVRDVTNNVVNSIIAIVKAWLDLMVDSAQNAFAEMIALWNFLKQSFIARSKELANGIIATFTGWVNGARSIVTKGMNDILERIEQTVNRGIAALNMLDGVDIDPVQIAQIQDPEAMEAPQPFEPRSQRQIRSRLQGRLQTISRGQQRDTQAFAEALGREINNALPDSIRNEFNVDGRKLVDQLEQWTGENVANRGR